ncbi:extracellular solute-binding protein, partial [bacterium]
MASKKIERCSRRSSNTPTSKVSRHRSSKSTIYSRKARWMYNGFGLPVAGSESVRGLLALGLFTILISGRAITLAGDAALSAEAEWDRTVKAAEQEGQVVVYKIAEDVEWHAFQKRFPKIKVVLVHGSAAQNLQRVMAERRAGKFLADVVRLGGGTSTTLYRAKALDPLPPALILPEVKDPGKWFEGRHHYNDGENQYTFVYAAFPLRLLGHNTKLVDSKAITSFWDLLDPKWKGKTTIKDPRDPGGGSPLLFLYHNSQLGPEYIKKLLTAGGLTLVRDERQQTDWLASGKFPIAITAKAEDVDEAKRQGLPV